MIKNIKTAILFILIVIIIASLFIVFKKNTKEDYYKYYEENGVEYFVSTPSGTHYKKSTNSEMIKIDSDLKSTEKTIWVNHILDETLSSPHSVGGWKNMHGFYSEDLEGIHWWLGIDSRYLGIRLQDVVVRFNNEYTYNKWVDEARSTFGSSIINKVFNNSDNVEGKNGSDVNVEFIFRWSDEEKTFDVHLDGDRYGEQK